MSLSIFKMKALFFVAAAALMITLVRNRYLVTSNNGISLSVSSSIESWNPLVLYVFRLDPARTQPCRVPEVSLGLQ